MEDREARKARIEEARARVSDHLAGLRETAEEICALLAKKGHTYEDAVTIERFIRSMLMSAPIQFGK